MSKNSHTSNGALEDHGTLADSELDAASGGTYEPAAVEVGDVKFTIGSSNYRATSKLTVSEVESRFGCRRCAGSQLRRER